MRLIPVIDMQAGFAVRAVGGARKTYSKLQTPLSASATFPSLVTGMRKHFGLNTFYVADLDAIEGRRGHQTEIVQYAGKQDDLRIWFDCGACNLADLKLLTAARAIVPVLATETLPDAATARSLFEVSGTGETNTILSLDYKNGALIGPQEVLEQVAMWPKTVIVMTLDCVGKNAGPDLARVAHIKALAGAQRSVFAAGGVRDVADIRALGEAGASGALIASALHSGKIKPGDLKEIAGF